MVNRRPASPFKSRPLLAMALCVSLSLPAAFPPKAGSAESVLVSIMSASKAIVQITSEAAQIFRDQPQAFRDESGRILVANKIIPIKYTRKGAGAIIDSEGIIVTNSHVVFESGRITVTLHDETQLQAKLLYVVEGHDIAFIQIKPPYLLPTLSLTDSDAIPLGSAVYTVGSSPLLKGSISEGTVSGLASQKMEKEEGAPKVDIFQVAFDIYKGDSGSPLLDREGKLVGLMAAAQRGAQKVTFAIASNIIKRGYREYLETQSG